MRSFNIALALVLMLGWVSTRETSIDVKIKTEFKEQLTRDTDLMTGGGAKIIEMGTNRYMVVSVGLSTLKNNEPSEHLRAVKVARIKANRNLVPLLNGKTVESVQWLKEKLEVQDDGKRTSIKSSTELIEEFRSKMIGLSLPEVGHWRSADGSLFFFAIGTIIKVDR